MTIDTKNDANDHGIRDAFIKEGMESYLEVTKALHLFQTEVAKVTKDVLEGKLSHIKAIMELEKEVPEVGRDISPTFPDDDWAYDYGDICSSVWLDKPEWCRLYLGLGFAQEADGKPAWSLFCAAEVSPQHRWRKWQEIVRSHPDKFDEVWENYAVGLRRPFQPSQNLNEGLTLILKDFLECVANSKNGTTGI